MKKAIRIIDIAEALGMSRNTVAKALNGQRVPDHTRKLVFEKAVALGYKGMGSLAAETGYLKKQRILIITSHPLSDLSFFMSLIRGIETTVRAHNFELVQYTFNENSTYRELTNYIRMLHLDGIICIEAFDEHFVKHILQLNIPVVFIDFLVPSKKIIGSYDIVLMNNVAPIKDLCRQLIDRNYYKTFGFVGDYRHCLGFYERFVAMREALFEASLPYEPQYSLTMSDDYPYGDVSKMKEKLREMHKLPQVFVCANDSIASPLIQALNQLNIRVPKDISVIGFDNSVESRLSKPRITTIHIDKENLGKQALLVLIQRMKHPKEKNRTIYVDTDILIRDSTN